MKPWVEFMAGASSPSSSGSRYSAQVTVHRVTSNQAKNKLAGAIIHGFCSASPLHLRDLSTNLRMFCGGTM